MSSIWFSTPATRWLDGLPVGNGRVGGMWFGDGARATIGLNDETFFSGGPRHRDLTGAHDALVEVRRHLRGGVPLAAQAAATGLLGTPQEMAAFQPIARLRVASGLSGESVAFRRSLDLQSGVAALHDERADGTLTQELVALRAPSVLVLRTTWATTDWTAEVAGEFIDTWEQLDSRTLVARGRWREGVRNRRRMVADPYQLAEPPAESRLGFAVALRLVEGAGAVRPDEGHRLRVAAGPSLLAVTTATDLDGTDPLARCLAELDAVGEPAAAVQAGIDWHRSVMERASVELDQPNGAALQALPTDRRMAALRAGGVDDQLLLQLADYGRYLLVASSIGGELPPTLQGIWNEDDEPAWASRWTLNINLQMNLWAAGPYGLPEVGDQFAGFLETLADSGETTAREIYGADGWVVHHNTDVWRATEPTTMVEVGVFPGATLWLCDQLWDLYRFGPRPELLARTVALLRGAAAFLAGWLVPDDQGYLVTSPSSTPEAGHLLPGTNEAPDIATETDYRGYGWLCESPTIDVWLVRALVDACLQVDELLPGSGIDRAELTEIRDRLRPIVVRDSLISDWTTEERPREVGHRHLSPLYGIFPGGLDARAEPELAAAAAATLLNRQAHVESAANGWGAWSRMWAAAIWARLADGERAYDSLLHWVRTGVSPTSLLCVFPEFDGRPGDDAVFQIDGNLGLPAAVAEMLVQSHAARIDVLPALPARWRGGRFRGLHVRGGHRVDAEWRGGRVHSLTIHPASDAELLVRLPTNDGLERRIAVRAGVSHRMALPA